MVPWIQYCSLDHSSKDSYKTIQKTDGSYVAVCKSCGTEYPLPALNTADAGIYKTTANIHLNSAPYQEAQVGNEIKKGASYTIVGSVLNAYGNKWYKTDGGYYIYKDYLTKTGEISSSFDCTLSSPSGAIQAGVACDVIGSVTSARTITDITAWVTNASGETIISKSCNPGGNSYSFYGSEIDRGLIFQNITQNGQYYFKVTISDDRSCSRVFTFPFTVTGGTGDVASLDLNGHLDGEKAWSIEGYGTVDVYVNGSPVADNVSDYCTTWPVGTTYEFKDFKPFSGYSYNGVYAGSRTGTVGSDGVSFEPDFTTINTASLTEMPTRSTFNGHTYLYYATPVTWYFAKEFCEEQGGHLVTITSAEENAFVWSLCDSQLAWFGGSDQDSEGSWKWVTNEPFSYSNWYSGEPNNCAGTGDYENFAHFSGAKNGQWNDTVGYDSHPFVCEIDSIPSGSTNAEIASDMSVLYKREFDGVNIGRYANTLVVYTNPGEIIDTNPFGYEIAVDAKGKVSAVRDYGVEDKLAVPKGGFVLSGHVQEGDSGGDFVYNIIHAKDARVVVNYDKKNVVVYGYPLAATNSNTDVEFTRGETRMDTGWADDEYEIVMGFTNSAIVLEYGITCIDSKGNAVVGLSDFKKQGFDSQGVDMDVGNHSCLFCLYAIDTDGSEHGTLTVGETYTWSGYAICNGIRYDSPSYTFTFSKAGSRYAKIDTYTITYHANSGTNAPSAQIKSEGLSLALTTGVPTRDGYTFLGWAETPSATEAKYQPGGSFTKDADTTLYAVWQPNTVSVIGVSLDKTNLALLAGESGDLTATVSPSNATSKSVIWTTSNTSVATVSNGTVTAVGAGTATITATTTDGGKKASCMVTVAPEPVDPNAPVVRVGDSTVTSGNSFTVPVEFVNNPGITGFSLELSYDTEYLELISVSDGDFAGMTKSKEISENPYVIVWNHGTADQTGSTAATLTFRAKDGVEGTAQIQVAFRNGEKPWNVMDETIPFTAKSGTVTISNYIPGDANGDGNVTGRDATRVVQHVAGWNVTIDMNAADANGDGTVSGRDATRIVQYVAGWNVTLGQTTPRLTSLLGAAPNDQRLVVGSGTAAPGDTVTIPVTFQNNPGITGFSIEIDYDDTALELVAARSGDFDGLTLSQTLDTKPYRVVWNHGTADMTGALAVELDFRVKNGASGSTTVSCSYISGEMPWNVSDDSVDFELVSGTVTINSTATLDVIGISGTTMTWHTDLNGAGKTLTAIAAWYDANGRQIGTSTKSVTANGSIGNQTISVGTNAAEYRLFLLDRNGKPVISCWKSK